jgi:predicted secreted protein
MKKYYLLFLVIISFLSGCLDNIVSTENQFDSSINGKIIRINKYHQFTLELDLNADAGYQWDYSMTDTSVVRIDSTNYRPKSGNWNQIGGVSIETFYFCGIKKGNCRVKLFEHQAWESNIAPINTIQFNIIIE